MVYVVVDEQNYYFQVLFELFKWLEELYIDGLYYFFYGMVDLFFGKMKLWEGIVVDVDDFIVEVVEEVWVNFVEWDILSDFFEEEKVNIMYQVGLVVLKFFIIKVYFKKWMIFDFKELVDL